MRKNIDYKHSCIRFPEEEVRDREPRFEIFFCCALSIEPDQGFHNLSLRSLPQRWNSIRESGRSLEARWAFPSQTRQLNSPGRSIVHRRSRQKWTAPSFGREISHHHVPPFHEYTFGGTLMRAAEKRCYWIHAFSMSRSVCESHDHIFCIFVFQNSDFLENSGTFREIAVPFSIFRKSGKIRKCLAGCTVSCAVMRSCFL